MRNPVSRGRFSYTLPKAEATIVSTDAASNTDKPATIVAPRAAPMKNRHQKRRDKAFNRRLAKRLKKDGIPAQVQILPDGGVHVTVKPELAENPRIRFDGEKLTAVTKDGERVEVDKVG